MTDPNAEAKIACGCGENAIKTAPLPIDNPPGLDAIVRRVGTHGTFLAALLEDLSAPPTSDPNQTEPDPLASSPPYPLSRLTTREPTDPTIAILDAWSTVADVITFYQERFANETYLRTATERKSIVELAKLVGYQPRPGVAASVSLAFDLVESAALGLPDTTGQPTAGTKALIPAGTQAQSLPKPGEQPQIFETSDDLNARAEWNSLPVRKTRQQLLTLITNLSGVPTTTINQSVSWIYFVGTATNLNPGSPLLLVLEDSGGSEQAAWLTRVKKVEPDTVNSRTRVAVEEFLPAMPATPLPAIPPAPTPLTTPAPTLIERLLARPPAMSLLRAVSAPPPRESLQEPDAADRVLTALRPELRTAYYTALANRQPDPIVGTRLRVFAPRQKAAPFGANAPQQATIKEGGAVSFDEWKLRAKDFATTDSAKEQIYLDQSYDQVHPGDYTVVERDADNAPASFQTLKVSAGGVSKVLRADYGLTGPSTKLTLDRKWHENAFDGRTGLDVLRRVSVYIQPEELTLAEEPIPDDHNIPDDRTELFDGETADTSDLRPSRIALDDYYPELETGRLLIVSGDRADLPNTSGARTQS